MALKGERRDMLAPVQADRIGLASEGTMTGEEVLRYDYTLIDDAVRAEVRAAALEIHGRVQRMRASAAVIGARLLEVKALLPHGQFREWVATEFVFSQRTAQYRMNVAARFGTKSETVALLNDAVLYLLAAPSTPAEVVTQVVEEAKTLGKSPTKARVQEVLRGMGGQEEGGTRDGETLEGERGEQDAGMTRGGDEGMVERTGEEVLQMVERQETGEGGEQEERMAGEVEVLCAQGAAAQQPERRQLRALLQRLEPQLAVASRLAGEVLEGRNWVEECRRVVGVVLLKLDGEAVIEE